MVSSASAQIETGQLYFRLGMGLSIINPFHVVGGEHLKTYIVKNGRRQQVPDYAKVSACQTVDQDFGC
jgi:hypothetical protein